MSAAIRRTSGPDGSPAVRVPLVDPRNTRLAFFGACFYLASQCFQIPLLAIGPSWAVWPVLSDLAAGILVLSLLIGPRHLRILSQANRDVYSGLLLILGATVVAFLFVSLMDAVSGIGEAGRTSNFGIFQIYRTAQFLLVFRVVAGLPLTRRRLATLSTIADVTLVLAFLGIVGTYTSLLPTPALVSHLPSAKSIAGPWVTLSMGQWYEAGTIGYNHSYLAVQLVLLAGLAVALRPKRNEFMDTTCLALASLGVFLSGSRAGMAAALFLVVAYLSRRPATMVMALIAFLLLFSAFSGYLGNLGIGVAETAERQLTLQRPLDPENLSGRGGIWHDSLNFLLDNPVRWVVGAGPGSAVLSGNNAHMLFLQVIMEGGILGLILFGHVLLGMMARLYRLERGSKAIFWTTGALLVSSFTQETLYPVPSMGHFLGLFLFAVAMALGINSNQPAYESRRSAGGVEVTRWSYR